MRSFKFIMLKRFAILLTILAIVCWISPSITAAEDSPPATSSLIVKLVSGLSPEEQAAVIASNGGIETSSIPALRLHVIKVPADQLSTIMQNYQDDPRVVSVEENKERKAEGEPSDTDYGSQWALPKIGWDQVFGIITPTGSATVAVLDTGVDSSHTELADKLVTCASILNGSDCTSDPNGHGTWMAGIIAANTDNNNGIAGVGYAGVKIMPVTVLSADGTGQDSDIIAGVVWAADNGADVILMGFSNPGFSENLQDAIDYAWSKNVVLVAAPGIDIETTDIYDPLFPDPVAITGTSPSAAIVAGVAGFMRAVEPDLSNGVVVGRLARTTDPAGTIEETGNGRVNMAGAVTNTSTDPIQPIGAPDGGGPFVGPYVAADVDTTTTVSSNKNPSGYGDSVTFTATVKKKNGANDPSCGTVNFKDGITTFATVTLTTTNVATTTTQALTSGSHSITAVYTPATSHCSFNSSTSEALLQQITKAPVTATAGSGSATYDGSTHTPSACVVSGDYTGDLTCTNNPTSVGPGAGTYTITPSLSGDTTNFDVTTVNGSYTITKADSMTTLSGTGSFVYDGSAHAASATVTGAGGLNESVSVVYSGACSSAPANVAETPCTVTATYAGDANHKDSSATGTITITKADATINVVGYTGVYDGNAHGATGTATGVKSESLSGLDLGSKFFNVPGGIAHWTFTGGTNYNDASGNVAIVIQAWTLTGFYQPVDMPNPNPILNTVKNGSTVPLKFEIFAGSTELTNTNSVNSLKYAQINCDATAPSAEIETTATGGTVLRYDTTGGQFIFNWKTPTGTAGQCFRVTMTASDNSTLVAYFKFK